MPTDYMAFFRAVNLTLTTSPLVTPGVLRETYGPALATLAAESGYLTPTHTRVLTQWVAGQEPPRWFLYQLCAVLERTDEWVPPTEFVCWLTVYTCTVPRVKPSSVRLQMIVSHWIESLAYVSHDPILVLTQDRWMVRRLMSRCIRCLGIDRNIPDDQFLPSALAALAWVVYIIHLGYHARTLQDPSATTLLIKIRQELEETHHAHPLENAPNPRGPSYPNWGRPAPQRTGFHLGIGPIQPVGYCDPDEPSDAWITER